MARELVHEWGHYHGWMNNFVAAREMALNRIRERYEIKKDENGDYFATRKVGPFDRFLPRYAELERVRNPLPTNARNEDDAAPAPTSVDVAAARQRWEEAKKSGDPDRMTRAANDLLRAVEADRAARGEPAPLQRKGGRHPTSEVLAPNDGVKDGQPSDTQSIVAEAARMGAEAALAAATVASGGPSVEHSGIDMSHANVREATDVGDPMSWPGAASSGDGWLRPSTALEHAASDLQNAANVDDLQRSAMPVITAGADGVGAALNSVAEQFGPRKAAELISLLASSRDAATSRHRPVDDLVGLEGENVGSTRLSAKKSRTDYDPLEPPVEPKPKRSLDTRDRRDPLHLDWSQQVTRSRLARMAREPLTPLTLLHLSHEVYRWEQDKGPPETLFPPGWVVIAISTDPWMQARDRKSGYQAIAVYHEASQSLIIINRGTEQIVDGFATYDLKSGSWHAQLDSARAFFSLVQSRIGEMERLGMKVRNCVATGHSLGGTLAQYQVMLSRNLRPEDIDYREGAPRFVGATFAAARARGALEAAVAQNFDNRLIVVTDASGRRHFRRRKDVYKLEATDSFQQYLTDYIMAGDGIALGDFLGDGERDVPRARRNMVGRVVILPGIEMPRVKYWREKYKRWPRPEIRGRLGQLNMLNHSLQNFAGSNGQLQSPLEDVVFDYRR